MFNHFRSSRFDETSYDDGSYSSKYDYDGDKREDEFLKTAHSQNIAASRNEYAKTNKQQTQSTQNPTYDTQKTTYSSQKPTYDTQKTTYSSQKPNYDTQKTTYSSQKPTYDTPKTTYSSQKPTYDAQKTTYSSQKPTYDTQKTTFSTQKQTYDSPRPFSATTNTPGTTKKAQTPAESPSKPNLNPKKTKDVSYDYAYYDTNVSSEPDYELDTEIKKSTVKN